MLILAPEREYRGICKKLGGAWINAAGGAGRINPLQVRPVPDVGGDDKEEEETETTVRGPLSAHLQRLKTFFQLYLPGLNDLERAVLEEAVLAAYREYGVDWHTEPETVRTWPTVQDVYRHVQAAGSERLAVLLKAAAEGADSALWAGQTTLPPAGDFTVLDIRDLTDASDHVRRAQYFNILGYGFRVHPITKQPEMHWGIDIAAPEGTPVLAAHAGTVTETGVDQALGNCVVIEGNGFETRYGHLSAVSARKGEQVEAGRQIGKVGNTGLSTGPHLDFRVKLNGEWQNHLQYF